MAISSLHILHLSAVSHLLFCISGNFGNVSLTFALAVPGRSNVERHHGRQQADAGSSAGRDPHIHSESAEATINWLDCHMVIHTHSQQHQTLAGTQHVLQLSVEIDLGSGMQVDNPKFIHGASA